MKLLLIEPANSHSILKNKFLVPPLALGVLANLTPPDWEVIIVQEPYNKIDFDAEIDLVGITATTNNVIRGYELADEFKKHGKTIIMGGIHPTILPQEALLHCDSVCIGEAELIWKDILEDFKLGKLKKTYQQKELFDLSLYKPPKRELMPLHRSFFFDVGTVETSRGCPYDCDFCSVSRIHGKKIRHRPLENLIPEIESIENRLLFFIDDNIISDFNRAKKLFREMMPLKKRWAGQATISLGKDYELIKLAADSGCFGLIIGIESVVKEGFEQYKKNLRNMYELKETIKILKDNGIGIVATMIFGNDFDTKDTISESLENLFELDLVSASLGILVPYPGTKLAEVLDKQKRILSTNWDYYDINNLVFKPKNFTCKEFMEEMKNLRTKYFSLRSICLRTFSYSKISLWVALGVNIAMRAHNKINTFLDFENHEMKGKLCQSYY